MRSLYAKSPTIVNDHDADDRPRDDQDVPLRDASRTGPPVHRVTPSHHGGIKPHVINHGTAGVHGGGEFARQKHDYDVGTSTAQKNDDVKSYAALRQHMLSSGVHELAIQGLESYLHAHHQKDPDLIRFLRKCGSRYAQRANTDPARQGSMKQIYRNSSMKG